MSPTEYSDLIAFLAGKFAGIDRQFENINRRFESIDHQFVGVNQRFERLEGRFDGLEGRFDGLEVRVGGLESEFRAERLAAEAFRNDMRAMMELVTHNSTKLDRLDEKVDRVQAQVEVNSFLIRAVLEPN